MSRAQSSLPSKSNPFRIPVPVMTQTCVPSVTGDGVDMFCLRSWWLPPPSGRCHSTVPLSRSTHQRCSVTASRDLRSSATLRKIRLPQTIGVDPDHAGIASFHATFSVCDHLTGRLRSPLTPFLDGPRHCGQFSATAGGSYGRASMPNAKCHMPKANRAKQRGMIFSTIRIAITNHGRSAALSGLLVTVTFVAQGFSPARVPRDSRRSRAALKGCATTITQTAAPRRAAI